MVIAGISVIVAPAFPLSEQEHTEPEEIEVESQKDWNNFVDYFYMLSNTTETKIEKEKDPDTKEKIEFTVYKVEVEEYDDNDDGTNDRTETKVGAGFIFERYPGCAEEVKEEYEVSKISDGMWIDADLIDAYTESALLDIIEALKQKASTEGIIFTEYQLYALASFFYDFGGVNDVKNDSFGIIAKYKEVYNSIGFKRITSYYGKGTNTEVNQGDEKLGIFLDYSFFKDEDAILFHRGYYTGVNKYYQSSN